MYTTLPTFGFSPVLPINRWFNPETGELMDMPAAMLYYDRPDPQEVEWARKRREEIAALKAKDEATSPGSEKDKETLLGSEKE